MVSVTRSSSAVATGSTASRIYSDRFADQPNVLDWDGADFETRFAAAISAAPSDERTVLRVNPGLYTITEETTVNKPVLLDCRGRGGLDSGANQAITGVRFTWGGSAGGYMFTFSGSSAADMILGTTTGDYLKGGGIVGAAISGNHSAAVAIWAASTQEMEFEVNLSRCTDYGLILDGGNGALSSHNKARIYGVWGAQAAAAGMTGTFIRYFNSFPSTRNDIWSEFTPSTGWGAILGDTDNNRIATVSHLWLKDDDGVAPARTNHVVDLVGRLRQDADCFGNIVERYPSEGSSVVDLAPRANKVQILSFSDYVSTGGEVWRSPAYKLRDAPPLTASMLRADGSVATSAIINSLWSGVTFPDSGTGNVTFNVPANDDWNDGWLIGLRVRYSTGSANTDDTIQIRLRGMAAIDGGAFSTPSLDDDFVFTVNDTAARIATETLTFSTPIAMASGAIAFFILQRESGEAGDTVTGNFNLLSVTPIYIAEGPDTSGSGPLLLKTQVACVATTDITLSGEQTLDGVLTSTSRVLVMGQDDASENGIYVSASGAWARATDMDAAAEFLHAVVRAGGGSVNLGKYFICTNQIAPSVGTTDIVFEEMAYPS